MRRQTLMMSAKLIKFSNSWIGCCWSIRFSGAQIAMENRANFSDRFAPAPRNLNRMYVHICNAFSFFHTTLNCALRSILKPFAVQCHLFFWILVYLHTLKYRATIIARWEYEKRCVLCPFLVSRILAFIARCLSLNLKLHVHRKCWNIHKIKLMNGLTDFIQL